LTDQDEFGHVIALNFQKKGEEHKTMIGGLFSFLISILLLVYFGLCINKLITGEDNLKFT
jgi:sorbitol-specific phosphotransferase system component IIC